MPIPIVWIRQCVAVSLMDDAGYRLIAAFGRGHVWDVGAGSGYHAWMLGRTGASVYASDRTQNEFHIRFAPVADQPDDARIAEIAREGGTALYFWPQRRYHSLARWIRLGGRRVITVGCFDLPDHCWLGDHPEASPADAPRICPPFPPPDWAGRFRLVESHTPPHFNETDGSLMDVMQLYELI